MSTYLLTLLALVLLELVHLATPSLKFLDGSPRSVWLSAAYVLVHFMPKLAASQRDVADAAPGLRLSGRHVFLTALAGLLIFYPYGLPIMGTW